MKPLAASVLLCFSVLLVEGLDKNDVVVVTVATEMTDGLKRLLRSAETFDIKVKVLGLGEKWNGGDTRVEQGGGQKIRMLREGLKEYAESDKIIMFIDAYDVIFTTDMSTILERFEEHFPETRVLFGAEPFCWPDESLAVEYPLVEFGKRYLNSGLFLGYAREVYKMISLKEVADKDDDQLYYTMIFLDEKLRKDLKMSLDSMARIFQNLNGVIDDVELQLGDDGQASAYNAAYNTHPAVVHGNGPSKRHLNYLGNYVAHQWSAETGCFNCGDKSTLNLENESDEGKYPLITVAIIIAKPIPFIEEALTAFAEQAYPKSRLALFVYNSQPGNIKTFMDFLSKYGSQYYTKRIINGVTDIGEREARNEALTFADRHKSDYVLQLDGEAFLSNPNTLRDIVEYSANYDLGIVAPFLNQPGKLFSNFWGAIAANGYYVRSEDYMAIAQGKRKGYWNVPFITSAVLIRRDKLDVAKNPYSYNMKLDPDMSFCQWARDNGHFLYVNNEAEHGFLIVSEEYAEIVEQGHAHPEMWEIFENRQLWEARYLHPGYKAVFEADEVEQACPDVYDYPLMSERYAAEMIEEMEAFGRWSDGSNQDRRLAGGYENVPTRDIHMNQIGYERQWLYFLDEYVRPMQEKVFIGYYHKPVESHMMFVVRYKPEEQSSLRPHHDASTFSIDIALNKKNVDYEGGGVRYVRYNCTVAADEVGYAMMFPGRLTHLHEGLPTTKGTRYILVSFINP